MIIFSKFIRPATESQSSATDTPSTTSRPGAASRSRSRRPSDSRHITLPPGDFSPSKSIMLCHCWRRIPPFQFCSFFCELATNQLTTGNFSTA